VCPFSLFLMRDLVADFRYAARQLRRTPTFTAVAVITLALGLGIQATVFDVVDAFAFKPIMTARVDDVYGVSLTKRAATGQLKLVDVPLNEVRALGAARSPIVEASCAHIFHSAVFKAPRNADTLFAEAVTVGYSGVYNLRPSVGRWLSDQDDVPGADPVVVISDRIWRAWFGADPGIIGHAPLKVNRQPLTIVGIAPAGFRGSQEFIDVWLPATSYPLILDDVAKQFAARSLFGMQILVRAKPDVPRAQAVATIVTALRQTTVGADPSVHIDAYRMSDSTRLHDLLSLGVTILAISSLILLAACANLANMLYARGLQRAAEIAVRVSLGGSRTRIGRLFVAEAVLIAGLAAVLGVALAAGGLHVVSARFPALRVVSYAPATVSVSPDHRVFVFALAAGLAAAMLVGLTTAWRVTRVPPLRTLASSGAATGLTQRHSWVRTGLVSLQITVAVVLVMTAGIFLQNVPAGLNKQLHFDTAHVVAGKLDLAQYGYNDDRGRSFLGRLVGDVRRLPGVDAAAFADSVPSGVEAAAPTGVSLSPEGRRVGESVPDRDISATYSAVSPGYLRALDIPLRRGRDFGAGDVDGAPKVAIISESAATVLWPGEDPIGRRIVFGTRVWLTVVGVSADPISGPSEFTQDRDVASYSARTQPSNYLFVPYDQMPRHDRTWVVLRSPAHGGQMDALRAAIRAIDEDVPLLDVGTIQDSMFAWYGPQRAARALSTTLGALALLIAILGVYGVVSYFVSARTREFGVRLALGASPGRVLKLVIDYSIHVVLVGLLPGVFMASVGSRLAESSSLRQLVPSHILMPNDIATWVVVPLLVLAAGVVAGVIPGLRAARLNPTVALRQS
jgi:predicted permease